MTTDTAPERIWLVIDRRGKIANNPDAHVQPCAEVVDAYAEYITRDLARAQVAAVIERAAKVVEPAEEDEPEIDPSNPGDVENLGAWKEGMWNAQAIRNITPTDATAALEAYGKRMKAEAMREAAGIAIAEDKRRRALAPRLNLPAMAVEIHDAILAAIPED